MAQVAHIRYTGGALLLPARDPYDQEIVFEEAEFHARRNGEVEIQFGRRQLRVRLSGTDMPEPCGDCHQTTGRLSFFLGQDRLCAGCAKGRLGFGAGRVRR